MKHVILFALGILLFSCGKKQESIFPSTGPLTESIYASGVLKTADQYQAFVTVNGIVNELLVKEGDSVHVGSPLLGISFEELVSTAGPQLHLPGGAGTWRGTNHQMEQL